MHLSLTSEPLTMAFVRTFAISRGSRSTAANVLVRLEGDGVVGWGEGAPNRYYYGQEQVSAVRAAQPMAACIGDDPFATEEVHDRLLAGFPDQPGARAAVDGALHDWLGKRLAVPVASLLGLPTGGRLTTSFTISLGGRGSVREAVEAAEEWPILKIKLGGEDDLGLMETVRALTDALLRVDANAAWTVSEAIEKCRVLGEMGVELVEQPVPPGRPEDLKRIREATQVPIVADESCESAADLPKLAGCVDGVNIKLAKTGGIREALRMALCARTLGLDVMLGCMVEGALGTAAAAQLLPLARWADLDGPLLLRVDDDPFEGLRYEEGAILMPDGPGLGVTRKEARATTG